MTAGKLYVLSYQDSKGPLRHFAGEVLKCDEDTARVVIYSPVDPFEIVETRNEDGIWKTGRDISLKFREPNAHEKHTVQKLRDSIRPTIPENLLNPPLPKEKKRRPKKEGTHDTRSPRH